MIAIATSERNGRVVSACLVREEDEIMLITDKAVVVRTRVSEVRALGRATQGVTLISIDEGSSLVGVQRIADAGAFGDEGEDDSDGDAADGAEASDNASDSSND